MQKRENYFEKLSDEDFLHVLEEFEDWIHNGVISSGCVLEKARDVYEEQNGAQGIIIMQLELLFVCARKLKIVLQDRMHKKVSE